MQRPPSFHGNHDDRPIMGKGSYGVFGDGLEDAEPPMDNRRLSYPQQPSPGPAPSGALPPGWPDDLPEPEPLSGNIAKEAEDLEELAGEFITRAMYSKNWQLRDAAVQFLDHQTKEGAYLERREAFRILVRVMHKGLKDKVANVFHNSLAWLQSLIDHFGPHVGAREVAVATEQVLDTLVDKLGDGNVRIREATKESILLLASIREASLNTQTSRFLKPVKNQNAWKPVLGVLTVLQDLVPLIGISKSGDSFDLPELMEYVGKAFNSPNADVRAMAIRVAVEAYNLVGNAVRKFMPKEMNPKIKEQLEEAFEEAEALGPPAPPPPPASLPPPPQRSVPSSAKSQRSNVSNSGYGAPPPPQGPGSRQLSNAGSSNSRPPPSPARSTGGNGGSVAGPSPRQGSRMGTPRSPAQQRMQSDQGGPPPAADDPGPFEEELALREQQLGPDHPEVAESCSNLAILYNQRGDGDRALPMYERALSIYEKAFGPEHPEVAHTLTDLAVLHLEQGRDEVGRPLLERALAIQEKLLGPDHPDVIAIRDVLNSE